MLASHFIILQAIWQNTLFIQQPYHTKDVFICFDNDGVRNDSWPSRWNKMVPRMDTLAAAIPDNSTQYKLKLIMKDESTQDIAWHEIYTTHPTLSYEEKIGRDTYLEDSLLHFLIYYITLCCSILIAECIVTYVWVWTSTYIVANDS